ncbi:MAG: HAMP domain-containing histidine kinase [Deltaproteobacteria bacterium]|nr:HAMP domain-containing histidine kinase [Deltaproteobacteria bacterium]
MRTAFGGSRQPLAAAEERVRVKAHLLTLVGHELATPLQTIRLTFELLEREGVTAPDKVASRVGFFLRAAEQLRGMLEPLLEYIQLDAGRTEYGRAPVDLAAECDAVLAPFRDLATARSLGLDLRIEADLVSTSLDRKLLRLALGDLVSNAIKYSTSGRIEVTVRRDGDALQLVVADEGRGIPEAALPRVFEPFERLDFASSRRAPGFGLGLALLHEAVTRHGGSITVASQVGVGSTFTVRVPGCFPLTDELARSRR